MDYLEVVGSSPAKKIPGKQSMDVRFFGLKIWALRFFIGLGIIALAYYFSWWFLDGVIFRWPWLAILLFFAVLYAGVQVFGNWLFYLVARPLVPPSPPPAELTVDVYVTAYREPYAMIERALSAACALRGAHRTYLLDDGSDPALEALAERLGAGYLTRPDHKYAKAGNLNAALSRTQGDIVVIFDIDHVPKPNFLEESLGYFANSKMGFVQVMLTFDNAEESWVAQAAMETSLEFYNPTSIGTAAVGAVTMMGSNALIRRSALSSIQGYRPGLAEDLATSISLHAAGWQSAYVAEPLAPGQAPPSFTAWFVQQLKWARGVFELLITAYPRLFRKLTWGQRLSYALRMTKYWIGPVIGLHLFATIAILTFASAPLRDTYHDYLIHITPLVLCDILIRFWALKLWQHPSTPRTSLSNAVALVYATWPIYLWAWLMAILRLPLSFRPTPKTIGRLSPIWLLPQIIVLALLILGTLYVTLVEGHPLSILLIFAIIQGGLQLIVLSRWMASDLKWKIVGPRYLAGMKSHSASTDIVRKEVDGSVRTYMTNLPFTSTPVPLEGIEKAITLLHSAREQGRRLFFVGEAGNQPIASLFACDFSRNGPPGSWPVFLLNGLEQAGHDRDVQRQGLPYQHIMLEEFASLVQPGDVLIAISVDGEGSRTLQTLQLARKAHAGSIALTGFQRGRVGHEAEVNLHLPSESEEQFEDGMLILEHILYRAIREMDTGSGSVGDIRSSSGNGGRFHVLPAKPAFAQKQDSHSLEAASRARNAFQILFALRKDADQLKTGAEMIRRVLEASIELLQADSGSLVLFDEKGNASEAALAYQGQVGIYPVSHLSDILQRGLAGWVAQNRQPALVDDTRADRRWLRRAWEDQRASRSAISAPLLEGERVFGVITLADSRPERFVADDLVLLAAVAIQVSFLSGKMLNLGEGSFE